MTTAHRPAVANLMCMMSMLVWAVGLPAADLLIGPVPPLQLTAARMAMATLCLLPVWWLLEGGAVLRGANWGRGVWIGGVSIGLGAFMLVVGQGLTDSVTVAVISAAMPVIGIGIEVVMDGKKITPNLVLGTLLSLVGGLMALGGMRGGATLGLGALLCFGAVLLFTVGSRLTVTAFPQLTALGRTTITLAGAALATGVAAAISLSLGADGPQWAILGLKEFGALVLFSIGGLAISQMLWVASIGSIGIALASLHINATPFYLMITLFALGGEWRWSQAVAAAIVGLGVLIAQGIIPLWRR